MDSYLDREIDNVLHSSTKSPHSAPHYGADDSPLAVQRLMQDAERLSSAMKAKSGYYGRTHDVDSSPAALRVTVNDLELRMSTISATISKILKEIENLAKELLDFQSWRSVRAHADEESDKELRSLSARVQEEHHARGALVTSVRNIEARLQNVVNHSELTSIVEVQRSLKKDMQNLVRHVDLASVEDMIKECINQDDFTRAISRLKSVVLNEIHTTLDDNLTKAIDAQDKDLRSAIRLELRKLEARLEDSIQDQLSSRNRSPSRDNPGAVQDLRDDLADLHAEMKSMRKRMEAQDEVIDGLLSKCDMLAEDNRRLRNLRVRVVEESAELKSVKDAVVDQDDKIQRLTSDVQRILTERGYIVKAPSPRPSTTSRLTPSPPRNREGSYYSPPTGSSQSPGRTSLGGPGAIEMNVPRLSHRSASGMEYSRESFSSKRRITAADRPQSRESQSRSPLGSSRIVSPPTTMTQPPHHNTGPNHRYSGQKAGVSTNHPGRPGGTHGTGVHSASMDARRITAKSPNRNQKSVTFDSPSSPGRLRGFPSSNRPHSADQQRNQLRGASSASKSSSRDAGAGGSSYWSQDAVRHLSISQFEASTDSDTTV